jgi:hypothetical protein
MADEHMDLKTAFEGLVLDQAPTTEQIDAARLRLNAVIAAEASVERRAPGRWIMRVAAAAAVLLAVVLATVTLTRTPITADANLIEIAEATRVLAADELPDGFYLYTDYEMITESVNEIVVDEEVVFIQFLSARRLQTWVQDDYQLTRESKGIPTFFDADMEELYYESGMSDLDRVGETFDLAMEGRLEREDPDLWSTDPDELEEQLMAAALRSQTAAPLDIRLIEVAESLMSPQVLAPPQLRAAIIEVIATLDVETTKGANGEVLVSVTFDEDYAGTVVATWTFDADGYLTHLQRQTLTGFGTFPPGTTYLDVTWSRPAFVAEAGVEPGE